MQLPETIKIGAFTHRVVYPYRFETGNDIRGQILGADGTIRLAGDDKENQYSATYVWQTLLHEIVHRVGRLVGSKELGDDEGVIDRVADLTLQILVDNGWLVPELPVAGGKQSAKRGRK